MSVTEKPNRTFVNAELSFTWDNLSLYFDQLLHKNITSKQDLMQWLKQRSELNAVLEEEFAWRYIRMNIDTTDSQLQEEFQYFVEQINPKVAPFENKLNQKLHDSKHKEELSGDGFPLLLRSVANQIELFREENIPLFTKLESESQKYGAISAGMSITYNGEEFTLQAASKFLKHTNRSIREEVYHLIQTRRFKEVEQLNSLFDGLIELRQKVATNADFENYRDYMFKSMERFDYTVLDCEDFHQSIKTHLVPLLNEVTDKRKEMLGLDQLRPWDLGVDIGLQEPLKPFKNGKQLLEKTIECFDTIDPFFGECLREMNRRKHLDLESKKGKAPGGFNYPLYESGYPFIYMNAVGSFRDVVTMIHEGGHAVHSVLSHELELTDFKGLTSEIAELASMSMELISMDSWHVFFDNEADLKRAKRDQLMDILGTLPWVATIDKFQHWIYTNKNHSVKDRNEYWLELSSEFSSEQVDWTGLEKFKASQWQRQLHLYEVPFYYIEYGMAQLGAIAMWRNYKKDPKKTIQQYKNALSLGYTKSIGEIYEAAGVKFDFSNEYVQELSQFIYEELQQTFND
jgi:oligoendopeptidase F